MATKTPAKLLWNINRRPTRRDWEDLAGMGNSDPERTRQVLQSWLNGNEAPIKK